MGCGCLGFSVRAGYDQSITIAAALRLFGDKKDAANQIATIRASPQ